MVIHCIHEFVDESKASTLHPPGEVRILNSALMIEVPTDLTQLACPSGLQNVTSIVATPDVNVRML
jgi:hypothetical protein